MAIYNGTQKVKPSGVSKVYVGSQLVYQGKGWHTIYEGSWSKTWTSSTSTGTTNICSLTNSNEPMKLRITATLSGNFYNPRGTITWIGESSTSFSGLPQTFTNKETVKTSSGVPGSTARTILTINCYRNNYTQISSLFRLEIPANSNTFIFNLVSKSMESNSLTLTVTKIEQYY